jgi:Iap family predicted aminopeptidase
MGTSFPFMRLELQVILFTLWLVCVPATSHAQQLQFSLINKSTIMDRVEASLPKNDAREQKIKQLFADAGCNAATVEQPVKHSDTPNVICRLQGETDEQIVVGAHYDKASAGTGTIDNWSGAALLASLYQGLVSQKRHHTFVFVAFAGEEQGLIGSEFFVKHMSRDELGRTKAMINLDTLGLSFTRIWVHRAGKNLVEAMLVVSGSMKLPVGEVDFERVGTTDSESFADKHIPSITIHSLTQKTLYVLHSSADRLQALHPDEYYDTYHLVQAYLAYLDLKLGSALADLKDAEKKH